MAKIRTNENRFIHFHDMNPKIYPSFRLKDGRQLFSLRSPIRLFSLNRHAIIQIESIAYKTL